MRNHTAVRYHDISCGHRVVGHEGKCQHLHGHNYRIYFACVAGSLRVELDNCELDGVGRVIDFSVIKTLLCDWLEEKWDHKFLVWDQDPLRGILQTADSRGVVVVPFNPTAENIAEYLATTVGPLQLKDTGITLDRVVVEETRKCSAFYEV